MSAVQAYRKAEGRLLQTHAPLKMYFWFSESKVISKAFKFTKTENHDFASKTFNKKLLFIYSPQQFKKRFVTNLPS